jgi:membrane-bound lytic murein transglycosylase D
VKADAQVASPATATATATAAEDAAAKTMVALPPVTEPVKIDIAAPPVGPDPALLFPRPPALRSAIAFWTDVFGKYSENQSVIHSMTDLGKIYTVLDYSDQAASMDPVRLSHVRAEGERVARAHIDAMLKHIDALKNTPDKLNPEERRIYAMFADSRDPNRFRKEIGGTRVQRGLRERTQQALDTSSHYLPEMERVFANYGLPTMLTRLPLVESSFNVNAYSKSGAAGVWQFIPSSARIYMRLDEVVDDRRDVWFSTDAAARHLRDDYDALRDWPLAVTAYNHGRGGIARGLIAVQGNSLSDLVQRYRNRNFGFASRNYYAEFLAACDVERNYHAQHPLTGSRGDTLHFDTVTTRDYLQYTTLRQLTGLDEGTFRALNPAYRPEVIEGRLLVPPGHEIRVPVGAAPQFMAAYAALPESERYANQRFYYSSYRVQRGDSLGKLARRYGVSTVALRDANSMKVHASIHVGQTLKIPPRESAPVVVATSKQPARLLQVSQAVAAQYRIHRIEAGQTLGEIARRYRTTVKALMELNELSDSRRLRVGSTIKIPVT